MARFEKTPEDKKNFSLCVSNNYRVYPIPVGDGKYMIEYDDNGRIKRGQKEYEEKECWEMIMKMYEHKANKLKDGKREGH